MVGLRAATAALLLLAFSASFGAVTRPDAVNSQLLSVTHADTTVELSHTVTSGTTLLVCTAHSIEGFEVTGMTFNSSAMTEIVEINAADQDNTDVSVTVYGMVSPTATTADVVVTYDVAPLNWNATVCMNYKGTESASVAAATSLLSTDINNDTSPTSTAVHAEAGTAGNALLFAGTAYSGAGDPASNDAGFTELVDAGTGTSTSHGDGTIYVAELLDGAPSAITVTWAQSEENASAYIEIVAESASAPSFTAGPTVSAATNGYTIGGTVDIDATVYAVACQPNSTAPTEAQVKAGDCTGDVDALIAANEAWTGTSADTFALTAAGSYPIHDVYVVASAAGGDSSLSTHADEIRSADSGQAIVTLTSISATSVCDRDDYFDPDMAANDVVEYDTTSTNAYTVTLGADCDFEIDAGGDTSQDSFDINFMDVSGSGDFTGGPPNWSVGDDTVWVNNNTPTLDVGDFPLIILDEDQAMDAIDFCARVEDADEDQLTLTVEAGTLPNGTSIGGTGDCTLSGTPDTEDEGGETLTLRFTDPPGGYVEVSQLIYVINTWPMPDITGDTVAAGEAAIDAVAPWYEGVTISTSSQCDESVASGDIISQDPEAGEVDDPLEAISAVVSTGECTAPGKNRTKGVTLPGVSIGQ